ncbi:hypothetical protein ACFLQJ_00890 [Calditrichota bacterium]
MTSFRILFSFLLIVLIFVGCASREPAKISTPATEKKIKEIPKWYLNPPQDDKFLFGPGTATSRDMQTARDKASQAGTLEISKAFKSRYSALIKRFEEEVGTDLDAQYLDQFTQVTKQVIDVELTGLMIQETEILNEDGVFRCYILMKLDMGRYNKMLVNEIKKQEQLYTIMRSSSSFLELDKNTGHAGGD